MSGFILDLGTEENGVSPYEMAAELLAAGDSMLRMRATERGTEAQAQAALERLHRRVERKRRQMVPEIMEVSRCAHCHRPLVFVVDGVNYCKRHAEEFGVRPKGKIT